MWTPSRRITRPYEKPPFEWTQRFGLDWRNSPISLDGLVGYYLMNEGGGNIINDLSGYGNNGTLYNDSHFVPGQLGPCLSHDGDDYVDCGSGDSLVMGTNDWTITCWVKTSSSSSQIFLTNGAGGNSDAGYRFSYSVAADFLMFIIGNGVSRLYPNSNTGLGVTDGKWHHLAVTVYRGDAAYFYFDGKLDRSEGVSSFAGVDIGATTNTKIGSTLNGCIDNLTVHNRALTALEIQQLYLDPFCMFHRKPIELWSAAVQGETGDWLGISSSELDSYCGYSNLKPLEDALDGSDYWTHNVDEVHWFIIDLGTVYNITKAKGRSAMAFDPTDVDIYVSYDKIDWQTIASGISTWRNIYEPPDWVEIDTTDAYGRYIKVQINDTDGTGDYDNWLGWGWNPPYTIFDVYGEEVGAGGEYEDFTTYTEVDPNSRITVTSSKVSWDDLSKDEEAYVYKDFGVDYFDSDFIFQFEAEIDEKSSYHFFCFWGVGNELGHFGEVVDGIFFGSSTSGFYLYVKEDGSGDSDSWNSPQLSTLYYITVERDDDGGVNGTGRITAYIRTGSHTGTLQDTLIVDCSEGEQNNYRYLFAAMSYDANQAANTGDGFTQNMSCDVEEIGAGDWLGISSSNVDSVCGNATELAEALDGDDYWGHFANETHWLILDLKASYEVTQVRGRSFAPFDPVDVNIYVSDDREDWGDAVTTGISTWQDRDDWDGDAIISCTPKEGRYIKVEIIETENGVGGYLAFGGILDPFKIFDVYGEYAGGGGSVVPTIMQQMNQFNGGGIL